MKIEVERSRRIWARLRLQRRLPSAERASILFSPPIEALVRPAVEIQNPVVDKVACIMNDGFDRSVQIMRQFRMRADWSSGSA